MTNKAPTENRPTLAAQLEVYNRVKNMSDEDIVRFFSVPRIDRFMLTYIPFIWRLLKWKWFCIWCGKNHFYFSEKKCRTEYEERTGINHG